MRRKREPLWKRALSNRAAEICELYCESEMRVGDEFSMLRRMHRSKPRRPARHWAAKWIRLKAS